MSMTLPEPTDVSAVIWDLEGALVDSLPGIGECVDRALAACGMPAATTAQHRTFVDTPLRTAFTALGVPDHDLDKAVTIYNQVYFDGQMLNCRLQDGVQDMMDSLRLYGIKQMVVSTRPADCVQQIAEHLGFDETMTHGLHGAGMYPGVSRNTKEEILDHALEQIGSKRSLCVMVGDNVDDIQVASTKDLPAVAVTWGYSDPGALSDVDAPTCDNVIDLRHILIEP